MSLHFLGDLVRDPQLQSLAPALTCGAPSMDFLLTSGDGEGTLVTMKYSGSQQAQSWAAPPTPRASVLEAIWHIPRPHPSATTGTVDRDQKCAPIHRKCPSMDQKFLPIDQKCFSIKVSISHKAVASQVTSSTDLCRVPHSGSPQAAQLVNSPDCPPAGLSTPACPGVLRVHREVWESDISGYKDPLQP